MFVLVNTVGTPVRPGDPVRDVKGNVWLMESFKMIQPPDLAEVHVQPNKAEGNELPARFFYPSMLMLHVREERE
jgi:hypothetical protein